MSFVDSTCRFVGAMVTEKVGCRSRPEFMTCVIVRLDAGRFFSSGDGRIFMVHVLGNILNIIMLARLVQSPWS